MIEFIQNIPLLLVYFVPGAITVWLFRYFTEREQDNNTLILYGVIISGLIKGTADVVSCRTHSLVAYGLVGVAVAIIAFVIIKSHMAQVVTSWLKITPTSNVLLNTIDLHDGTRLMVHMKSGDIFCGRIDTIDKNWITLWEYELCDPRTGKNAETYTQGLLCIPMSEVKCFETAYENDDTPIMRIHRKQAEN